MGDFYSKDTLEGFLQEVSTKTSEELSEMLNYQKPKFVRVKPKRKLSKEIISLTEKIFTNLDLPVAGFKISGLLQGMIIAKQSRAVDDCRVVTARLINSNKELYNAVKELNTPDFISRVGFKFIKEIFDEYGDDSVARDVSFGAVFEGVSLLEAMSVFHHRVLFGIEKSTRYVDYSKKINEKYNYVVDPLIVNSGLEDKFRLNADSYFELYSNLMNKNSKENHKLLSYIKTKVLTREVYEEKVLNSLAEKNDTATKEELNEGYEKTISAAFKDQTRHLIPLCARTSLGVEFNALALRHFLTASQSRLFGEGIIIGEMLRREMMQQAEPFLDHVGFFDNIDKIDKRSKEFRDFYFAAANKKLNTNINSFEEAKSLRTSHDSELNLDIEWHNTYVSSKDEKLGIETMLRIQGGVEDIVAGIIISKEIGMSYNSARTIASRMSQKDKLATIYDYVGMGFSKDNGSIKLNGEDLRLNRRHRPGRAFENMTLDLTYLIPIGDIRDLRRHTLQSYIDPLSFNANNGFYVANSLKEVGIGEKIDKLNKNLQESVYPEFYEKVGPYAASLTLPLSTMAPMNTSINAREAFHMFELRTQPGAGPVYLRACQMAYACFKEYHPEIAKTMKFVNTGTEIDYGRSLQEMRSIKKRKGK